MALNKRILTMVALAVGAGTAATIGADQYLAGQSAVNSERVETVVPQTVFKTIVAASESLRFGSVLTKSNLTEIPWPEEAIPEGAFTTVEEIMAAGRRVALKPIETNEPILKSKITGPDGRAGLASVISLGMRATTVRVNDVAGVAGFILPGDRVDVVWTRDADEKKSVATVIEQNVKVLTIDQVADERAENPQVVQAVTLEVNAVGAQRLTLASTTGTLSLVLRRAGDVAGLAVSSVSTLDLDAGRGVSDSGSSENEAPAKRTPFSTVWVTHADTRLQHSVPSAEGQAIGSHETHIQ